MSVAHRHLGWQRHRCLGFLWKWHWVIVDRMFADVRWIYGFNAIEAKAWVCCRHGVSLFWLKGLVDYKCFFFFVFFLLICVWMFHFKVSVAGQFQCHWSLHREEGSVAVGMREAAQADTETEMLVVGWVSEVCTLQCSLLKLPVRCHACTAASSSWSGQQRTRVKSGRKKETLSWGG